MMTGAISTWVTVGKDELEARQWASSPGRGLVAGYVSLRVMPDSEAGLKTEAEIQG